MKKNTNSKIDFSQKNPKVLGAQIRKAGISETEIGDYLTQASAKSNAATYNFTRSLIHSQNNKEQFVSEGLQLFKVSKSLNAASRKATLSAIVDETGQAGSLFLIQNISGLKQADARVYMKDLIASGGSLNDVALWLQLVGKVLRKHHIKNSGTAGSVVDAIGDAAEWVVDAVEDGVDAILEGINAIIDAVTDIGAAIVDLFEDVVSWTAEQMGNLLAALIEAGIELGEFVSAVFDWTYAAVSTFVEAAFSVAFTIADLLETVVSESYFVFRRFINGILENLGPVGDILDFVLTQVEDATSRLWRNALLAMRFAEANLIEALDWMAAQTNMAITAIINAWESIGENLLDLYEWALTAGAAVWYAIGEATMTLANSMYYVYNFLTTSGVQFIFDFTRGLLRAGKAIADVIGWAVDQSIEVCAEIMRAALDIGISLGTMMVEIARDPGNALNTFVSSMLDIGQTMDDLYQATIVETFEEFLNEVNTACLEIGLAVVDILVAVLKLGGAFLTNVIADLLNRLGSYRSLNDLERADAELVFGNSLDYELISLSNEDPLNAIIFGIQDFFAEDTDSRAFVTGNLINFDVKDGTIDRLTLIHELTHVWQHRHIGGIYMSEAIIAQATGDGVGTSGYNYGYDDSTVSDNERLKIQEGYDGSFTTRNALGAMVGKDGEAALNAAGGNFDAFNPEMQGQILMHWFARTQVSITDINDNPVVLDSTAWDPYQSLVFNS